MRGSRPVLGWPRGAIPRGHLPERYPPFLILNKVGTFRVDWGRHNGEKSVDRQACRT